MWPLMAGMVCGLNLGLFNVLIYVKEENPNCVTTCLLEPQILYFI